MRILFVFGYPIRTGGHFKSALSHMKHLVAQGHVVCVAAPFENSVDEMVEQFRVAGVKIVFLLTESKTILLPSLKWCNEIQRICKSENIDLIHSQDFLSLSSAFSVALLLRKGFVFTQAGGPVKAYPPPNNSCTIFYSRELYDGMITKYHLNPAKIFLVESRIDTSLYKPSEIKEDFILKYNLPREGKKIIMVLRLDLTKKTLLQNVIDFAKQPRDCSDRLSIVIAGEGPLLDWMKEQSAKINRAQNKTKIQLMGPVFEQDDLNQLYNYSDMVVGHGRGILEAMACGKPVINLGEEGQACLVGEGNIGPISCYNYSGRHFRYEKDSQDLATVLSEAIRNSERLKIAGTFSLQYISDKMEAGIGAQHVLNIYKCAVKDKPTITKWLNWYLKLLGLCFANLMKKTG